jgi:hypothetical protein
MMNNKSGSQFSPGPIALFGSGETSPSGQKIFKQLLRTLPREPRIALLETPAGFELNSALVTERVADFLNHHLQNYNPQTEIIPARKRGTPFSPDDAKIAAPLLHADLIFAGPGSPSYAVRQLQDSLTWHYLLARHRIGATLAFSSAAVIAIGAQILPVYELYKVGEDLHWKPGLDFFASHDLSLIFIPHWNNSDGGAELDTSRCYMGQARFGSLLEMLPAGQTVVGIDELTALIVHCAAQNCEVQGKGNVTLHREGEEDIVASGDHFSLSEIGGCRDPEPLDGIPTNVWQEALDAATQSDPDGDPVPSQEILALIKQRELARSDKDWVAADEFRAQITSLGWQVKDTPEGPELSKI